MLYSPLISTTTSPIPKLSATKDYFIFPYNFSSCFTKKPSMDSTTTEKTSIKYQAVIDAIRKAEPNRVLTTEEIADIIQQSSNAVRSTSDGVAQTVLWCLI
jgi:hypothetical protein